jgi:hypothetical protein
MKQFWKQYYNYSHGCSIPVAARSKALVCDRSLAGIVGSNLTRGMAISFECCLFFGRDLFFGLITLPEEFTWWPIQCTIIGACVTYTSVGNAA